MGHRSYRQPDRPNDRADRGELPDDAPSVHRQENGGTHQPLEMLDGPRDDGPHLDLGRPPFVSPFHERSAHDGRAYGRRWPPPPPPPPPPAAVTARLSPSRQNFDWNKVGTQGFGRYPDRQSGQIRRRSTSPSRTAEPRNDRMRDYHQTEDYQNGEYERRRQADDAVSSFRKRQPKVAEAYR